MIIMTDVIEYLAHPQEVLTEIKRILKPNGSIYITTLNKKA